MLKYLRGLDNTDVMKICLYLATEEDGGPFRINRGDIGLSPAIQETTQTDKQPEHYTKTGGQNTSSSLKKKRKHTQWVRAP